MNGAPGEPALCDACENFPLWPCTRGKLDCYSTRDAYRAGYAAAQRAERSAIVGMLRSRSWQLRADHGVAAVLTALAHAVEARHRKEVSP